MSDAPQYGLEQARAQLPLIASEAVAGYSTVITRHGKPVADLVPVAPEAADVPSYLQPFEPLRYERPPSKSGAQMIIDERESDRG